MDRLRGGEGEKSGSGRQFFGQEVDFIPKLGSKKFLCQNLFQVIYNHNLRSNVTLEFFLADRKQGGRGVNPFGQPDRKKNLLVFEHFPEEKGAKNKTKMLNSVRGHLRKRSKRPSLTA